MTQDEVFKLICKKEGISAKEISKELNLHISSVSRSISLLKKKKLIRFEQFDNSFRIYKQ